MNCVNRTLKPISHAQLTKNGLQAILYGFLTDSQVSRDLVITIAFDNQFRNRDLADCQAGGIDWLYILCDRIYVRYDLMISEYVF
jgi:hypothetical protein